MTLGGYEILLLIPDTLSLEMWRVWVEEVKAEAGAELTSDM